MTDIRRTALASAGRRLARNFALWLALAVLAMPGCGGCRPFSQAPIPPKKKEELAKKPKPKPDFERLRLAVEPNERPGAVKSIKPGHWVAATVETKANNFDFSGTLITAPTDTRGSLLDLERTPFRMTTARPAVLPKGQDRRLETSLFVPRGGTRSWITTQLRDGRGGHDVGRETEVYSHMPGYQYFLVGLVREPTRYRWLKVINSVRPVWDDLMGTGLEGSYYRVELPATNRNVPLPAESLCWTSLAYIVWDDVEPSTLDVEQQQALVDWLQWGGQLIVSGPKTLDLLKHGFLAPYLPATAGSPRELAEAALAELNSDWTIPNTATLTTKLPWSGITLDKHSAAMFVPGTGELVAERRVGQGRIVVTAFRLVERELIAWPSFDSFVNGCLLRRPRRSYVTDGSDLTQLVWSDFPEHRFDPELVCQLRYFTRDTALPNQPRNSQPSRTAIDPDEDPADDDAAQANLSSLFGNVYPSQSTYEQFEHEQNQAMGESGVGGWNDFGPVASAARRALKQAAGITIPRRDFVLKVVLGYLLVLVPINWGLFRLIGRVEWAWIAAPGIAVVCAGLVIWLAQLDIGFARSSNEIAVVELQGGYSRGHVTRYTALYSSLSTTYDINIEQPSALALPFATDAEFVLLTGQLRSTVTIRRDTAMHLTGFAVSSNSTGMIHSEHLAEMEGAVSLAGDDAPGPAEIVNTTALRLRDAGVLRKRESDGELQMAWLGDVEPGGRARVAWRPADDDLFARERERSPLTAQDAPADTLSLRPLVQLAENPERLMPGDVRLVGWIAEELPGVRIEPAAAQARHATLAVVNLRHAPIASPERDTNLPPPVKRQADDAPTDGEPGDDAP